MIPVTGLSFREATREDDGPELMNLLDMSFPDTFEGRTFFKQQPHARILAFKDETLIGQVGLDFRVISVDGNLREIGGVIDLCVAPRLQGCGVATMLLSRAEDCSIGRDFMVLMADDARVYERNGYRRVDPAPTRFLAIEALQSHSLMERDMGECMMIKQIGSRAWPDGWIDMLGYVF